MAVMDNTNPHIANNLFEESGFIYSNLSWGDNDSYEIYFTKTITNGTVSVFRDNSGRLEIYADTKYNKTHTTGYNVEKMWSEECMKYIEKTASEFINISSEVFSFFEIKSSSSQKESGRLYGTETIYRFKTNKKKIIVFASNFGIIIHTHGKIYYINTGFGIPWEYIGTFNPKSLARNKCKYIYDLPENISLKKEQIWSKYYGFIRNNANIKMLITTNIATWEDINKEFLIDELKYLIFG